MARILFTWELGGGLGHITRIRLLAKVLRQRGHEVLCVLQDLSRAESLLGKEGFTCLQAPVWLPQTAGLPAAASYPEVLFRFGYQDPEGLLGVVRTWRSLYQLLRPDMLIADHAPTSLLAARGLGMRSARIGNSFAAPPPSPMPPFRTWESIPARRLEESEKLALASVNQVLERIGLAPQSCLSDVFAVDENFLCDWQELDQYPQRPATHYWGSTLLLGEGAEPVWPMGEGSRIFAYLQGYFPHLDALLSALRGLPFPTLVYAAGLPPSAVLKYQSANLAFATQRVNMEEARRKADLILCHGGDATVAAALLAGRPLMVLPLHAEQYATAQRVEQLGAGLNVAPDKFKPDYRKLVRRLLGEPSFTLKAQAFADKYRGFDGAVQIERIADRCEQLLQLPPC